MKSLIKIASSSQMQKMDSDAIKALNITSIELMYRAAHAVFTRLQLAENTKEYYEKSQSLLIVCGKGNNGGDGYCLANLFSDTKKVFIYELEHKKERSPDAKHYHRGFALQNFLQSKKK